VTVRAAIVEEVGRPLVIEEVELRAPGPHEVVVRITAVDVCITDALSARGDSTRGRRARPSSGALLLSREAVA
jgi:Zn-dependent alcohol dehydrogenase